MKSHLGGNFTHLCLQLWEILGFTSFLQAVTSITRALLPPILTPTFCCWRAPGITCKEVSLSREENKFHGSAWKLQGGVLQLSFARMVSWIFIQSGSGSGLTLFQSTINWIFEESFWMLLSPAYWKNNWVWGQTSSFLFVYTSHALLIHWLDSSLIRDSALNTLLTRKKVPKSSYVLPFSC